MCVSRMKLVCLKAFLSATLSFGHTSSYPNLSTSSPLLPLSSKGFTGGAEKSTPFELPGDGVEGYLRPPPPPAILLRGGRLPGIGLNPGICSTGVWLGSACREAGGEMIIGDEADRAEGMVR